MGNVMVIDQIRNVPDLHVNYNSICSGSFLDDYWRPRQLIRNAGDYQDWVANNKAENLKHFQLIVPAPVWDELGKHLKVLGFKPTYRQSVIHA